MQIVLDDHAFISTDVAYGRSEKFLSIHRFATALAPLIAGAQLGLSERDCSYGHAELTIGELRIYISGRGGTQARPRPILSAGPVRSTQPLYNKFTVPKFPDMTVDPSRPLDKIAAEVQRKLIAGSAEPLAKLNTAFANLEAGNDALSGHVARLRKAFPQIRLDDPAPGDLSVRFSLIGGATYRGDAYMTGELNSDGGLRVAHMGTLKPDALDRVLTALLADA